MKWFLAGFMYYGLILLSTELFHDSRHLKPEDEKCSMIKCKLLPQSFYFGLIWTSLAEFSGGVKRV